jgi:poly(A) polymerase
LARPEHVLSRRCVSTNALKVLYRLHRSGYVSFLVGGGVRDILLGREPKDFDVATNARPQEIRRLFRNSRIIGRRFRLVHVLFRGEVVEVSTFRASPEPPEVEDWEEAQEDAAEESAGEVRVSDESYGTPAEDARRRDLTVNALFYNIADFSIIDYVGGLEDLETGIIRTIGVPDQRFEEDPVRMMRALEYSVRLGFSLDSESQAALDRCSDLISEAAPARLTYELIEGLRSGNAAGIWSRWSRFGIVDRAFPELARSGELGQVLDQVDSRSNDRNPVPDASLLGALFLPQFADMLAGVLEGGGKLNNPEVLAGLSDMLEPAASRMHLPNHTMHLIRHGLFSIGKLRRPPERGRQVVKLCRQEYFPVAWDLFSFGVAAGLVPRDAWNGWSRALGQVRRQGGGADDLVLPAASRARRRRRPRRRRKK